MKNFKLLLATTAILSMGLAFRATATDLSYQDNADIKVRIDLYDAAKITVSVDTINFGVLAGTGDHSEASVTLSPASGQRAITGSGVVAARDDDYQFAEIAVNVPDGYKATVTSSATDLMSPTGDYDVHLVPQISKTGADGAGTYTFEHYRIGGSINLSEVEFHGKYTGTITVTAVVAPK